MVTNVDHMICLKKFLIKLVINLKNQNWIHVRLVILLYYKLNNVRITINQQKILLQQQHETHKNFADLGYMQKKRR